MTQYLKLENSCVIIQNYTKRNSKLNIPKSPSEWYPSDWTKFKITEAVIQNSEFRIQNLEFHKEKLKIQNLEIRKEQFNIQNL